MDVSQSSVNILWQHLSYWVTGETGSPNFMYYLTNKCIFSLTRFLCNQSLRKIMNVLGLEVVQGWTDCKMKTSEPV